MATPAPAIVLILLLSLPWLPESAPGHRIHGGWTLNSAGYLLGPVIQLPRGSHQTPHREAKKPELTAWWGAKDGPLPPQPPEDVPRRGLGGPLPRPEISAWPS
ncbi:galanin-like peptide [Dromiciops gliroides]|uniref:galanin-like peptide n=1 Tax=Dromiciops gliroides TaxID=33562 RepID=UPI001CC7512B|nr:galanin-like peptide [Dromiciops gliroides]